MTQGRDAFSLAHRAALIVAALAAMVVMASTSYALDDTVVVTNQGALLAGTILSFDANGHKAKNIKPTTRIVTAGVPGLSVTDVLTGIGINPTNGSGVFDSAYVLSDFDFLAPGVAPAIMSIFAPGATGTNVTPIGLTLTTVVSGVLVVPLALPQDVTFSVLATTGGPVGTDVGVGDVFVSNFDGGPGIPTTPGPGSIVHFPPDVATALNPAGLITNPFGMTPAQIPALVLQDSVFDPMTNPFGCATGVTTGLAGPVGVRLDTSNNIWVVNSGTADILEYPPGAFGCTPATNAATPVGAGTLVRPGYLAIDALGDLWVTDLGVKGVQRPAVFEFSPSGALLATIQGKKTGLKSPMGIALGGNPSNPNVYVADVGAGAILKYEGAEDGGLLNIKTATRIQGNKTKMNQPVDLAIIP